MSGAFITEVKIQIKPDLDCNTYEFWLAFDEVGDVDMATRGPLDQALIHMKPYQLVKLGKLLSALGEFWE